jgi:hypothetical protein
MNWIRTEVIKVGGILSRSSMQVQRDAGSHENSG